PHTCTSALHDVLPISNDFRHRLTGTLTLKGAERSRLVRTLDDLRCSCREDTCAKKQAVVSEYKRSFLPEDAVSPDQLSRLDRLASVDETDWQSKDDEVKNVQIGRASCRERG